MPLDLSRVQGVFQLVIEQTDPAARQRVLDEQCAENPQLRARVELLARAHDQPRELPAAAPAAPPRMMQHAGMVVAGRYKLLELLGEGGMGAVWVVEQAEPIRRRVALKLIKPGMDSKQVLSRFEAERQALALMEHPNIAKVFDGGMTDEGRPYFAMEYVKGVPITDYCDQAKLSVTERMKLFIPVCQAVQHAHQKGVIHRDLKPSNILVCLYDGQPIPKVIDFGLAKAISQRLTENTLYTAHGLMVGTPMYMSPEQAEFNNLDVDTRADIYSLGVILYELLTGSTPLEKQKFQDAAFAEILRIIKEDEPQRPSTKVSTSAALPTLAAQRSVDPAQLSRQVRGELDWIVMKSLEKERSRRYETADGLARDLERFLKDEPVEACPPSLGYRFGKALRRNRKWFSAGAAALLVLFTLTGAIGWVVWERWHHQAEVESRAHAILDEAKPAAEAGDLQRVEQVVAQAESLLATVDPNQELIGAIHNWKADLELVRQLEQADRQLAEMVFDEDSQRQQWVTLYSPVFKAAGFDPAALKRQDAIDWLQASPLRDGLASVVDTWAMHSADDERDRLLDIVREADPPAWRNRLRDALVRDDLAALRQLAGDKDCSVQTPRLIVLLESALSKHGERSTAIELLRDALEAHPQEYWLNLHLGQLLLETRGEQAIVPARAALAAAPQSAAAHNLLGGVYCLNLKPTEAEEHFRKATELQRDYATAHMNLAFALGEQKKYSEALIACEQALQLQPLDPYIHLQHGNLLRLQGNSGKSNEALRKALQLAPDDWLVNGNFLSQFKLRSAQSAFADECFEALTVPGADPRWWRWMAEVLRFLDRPDESEIQYRVFLSDKPHDPLAQFGLVSVLMSQDRTSQAEVVYEEMRRIQPDEPATHLCHAVILFFQKRFAEAEESIQQVLQKDAYIFCDLEPVLAEIRRKRGDSATAPSPLATRLASNEGAPVYRGGRWLWKTPAVQSVLAPTVAHADLGSNYACIGRFRQASQHYLADFKDHPQSENSAARAAMLQLLDGDRAGYEMTCREMLERFADGASAVTARIVLQACVLGEPPVGTPDQLRTLVEQALERDHPERSSRQLALLAVRNSNWQEALHQCRIGRTATSEISMSPGLRSQILILESLAFHYLKLPDEAKAAYCEAARQIDRVSPYAPREPGTIWFDWGPYELSRRKAADLLGIPDEPWDRQAENRAHLAICKGDWRTAAAELQTWCRDPRAHSAHWMAVPSLLIMCGDTAGYRQQCEEMRVRFAASEMWEERERVCKTSVILPGFDKSVLPIAQFTEPLENGTSPKNFIAFGYASWAIIDYRTGAFHHAIVAAKKVLEDPQVHFLPASQALLVAALASQKLGQTDEARQYFERARKELETARMPLQPDGSVDVAKVAQTGTHWVDAFYIEVLRKEAAELLEAK